MSQPSNHSLRSGMTDVRRRKVGWLTSEVGRVRQCDLLYVTAEMKFDDVVYSLSEQSERDMRMQYHRSVRTSTDPYKRYVKRNSVH